MTPQEERNKRFDAGCNTDNISDPPSDKEWIKSFITSEVHLTIEQVEKWAEDRQEWITKHSAGNYADGYKNNLIDLLTFLKELKK